MMRTVHLVLVLYPLGASLGRRLHIEPDRFTAQDAADADMVAPLGFISQGSPVLKSSTARVSPAYTKRRIPSGSRRKQFPKMMVRKLQFGDDAREPLVRGVDQVANAVKVTLGPRGRNVIIMPKNKDPAVINDGVTIASFVRAETKQEDIGVKLLLQAASQTDNRAGDGTTTATVLTQAMVNAGKKLTTSGHSPIQLQKGLIQGSAFFSKKILEMAQPIQDYEQYKRIASLSANSEELGAVVAEAIQGVGPDGAIFMENGDSFEDIVEVAEGMEVDVGWLNMDFVKDLDNLEVELENPYVLVTNQRIQTMAELLPLLEQLVEVKRPILIIAKDLKQEALSGLVLNVQNGVIDACVVKAPGGGDLQSELLKDIATYTGAKFFDFNELGMRIEDAKLADLGNLTRAKIEQKRTVLISDGSQQEAVDNRLNALKTYRDWLERQPYKMLEVQQTEGRIVKLRAAIAKIKVGAATEAEAEDKKLRFEDSINALRGAIYEGMVPGGGSCLLYMTRFADEAKDQIEDPEQKLAIDILVEAMRAPITQIAHNSGLLGALVAEKVSEMEWGMGFNALKLEYENLFDAGIMDPATVTTWGLENAASIAGSILTTEALVYDPNRDPTEDLDPSKEWNPVTGEGGNVREAMW